METPTKERLVGAIVLVAIVVVVVPEVLTGPRAPTGMGGAVPAVEAPAPSSVRTVTIDLSSEQRRVAAAPVVAPSVAPSPAAQSPAAPSPARTDPAAAAREPPVAESPASAPVPVPGAGTPGAAAPVPREGGSERLSSADVRGAATPPAAGGTSDAGAGVSRSTPVAGTAPGANAASASTRTPASTPTPTPTPTPAPAAPPAATSRAPAPAPRPPATETKPAPAVPASAQGWVVQLGSFASRANAERLATELRGRGYSGFVSEYRGSGKVLFRVRVGPEQDRARAEAIAQRLARDGKRGTVAPHP